MAERLHAQLQALLLYDVEKTGKELGRGAYGVVFEVRVSGLVCAGKTLHEAIVQNDTLVKFAEECLCHSQQRHPNIVQLMGVHFSQHSRLPMLVMEYLPLSLTQCLETHQDLPLQIKYSILLDVAKGLNYLHCKRPPIVHRDLTANNILLTSNFIAKISDLGVSRMIDTFKLQRHTAAPGNTVVMPPEALKDNPRYDQKLDVFSYGCLILHVFTHQWPVPTAQYVRKRNHRGMYILVSEWDRRSKYTEQISNDPFRSFVKCCLENNAKNRPVMSDAIRCIEGALSEIPPLKNKLEMMKEISDLEELVQSERSSKENELSRLQDIVQKSEQAMKQAHESQRKLAVEKINLSLSLSAKQKEVTEQAKLLQVQASQSRKYQRQISVAKLMESEHQTCKKTIKQKEIDNLVLQQQLTDLQQQLTESNSSVKSLTDENVKLQADMLTLTKGIENTLKSKDELITILESELPIPPSYNDQKERIRPLMTQELKQGDSWYLVSQRWFTQWKIYVGYDSDQSMAGDEIAYPGPLNTVDLFEDIESQTLKDDLKEIDYALLPKPVWDLLVSWYGLSVESQPICRYVVEYGIYHKHPEIEIYKLSIKVCVYPQVDDITIVSCSRIITIDRAIQNMREMFNISSTDECRLWHCETYRDKLLNNLSSTFSHALISDGEKIMLEVRNHDGSWPKKIELKLCIYPHTDDIKLYSFGVFDTIGTVKHKMTELFNISATNEIRLSGRIGFHDQIFTSHKQTLYDVHISKTQTLMLEVRNHDGSWPRKITLELCIHPNTNDIKQWSFDVFDTIETLMIKAKEVFRMHPTLECRVWRSDTILLSNTHETLMKTCTGFYEGKTLMLEVRNPNGSWPRKITLKLCVYPHTNDIKEWSFEVLDTIDIVVQMMKRLFKIPLTNKCRLWKKCLTNRYTLVRSNRTLYDDSTLNREMMYLLEIRNTDGSWPRKTKLKLCVYPNIDDIKLWSFDVFDTVGIVIQKIQQLFNVSETDECRLLYSQLSRDELLTNYNDTLFNIGVSENELFILEVRSTNGNWPMAIQNRMKNKRKRIM